MTSAGKWSYDWLCRGMKEDLYRRAPHYISDWRDVFSWKILAATLFIFVSSFGPAITFSVLITEETDNTIGVIEVLLSTAISGVLMSIFAGQPIVIVGVTGPISILTASIYTLSKQFHVDFISFYAWAQIWSAIMHIILAMTNACDAVKFITNFSCETFGVLIALIYIYTGLNGIAQVFLNKDGETTSFAAMLLQLLIALGVAFTSFHCHNAKYWILLNNKIRNVLTDYGPTISVVAWSVVPYLAASQLDGEHIPTLNVPAKFSTTSGRSWLVPLDTLPVWAIFAAIFPGLIITILFYFDHNVSSVMSQTDEMKLKKGSAFHWDFFVLGIGVLITGILGLPPSNGLIPQAPLHAKSLIKHKKVYKENSQEAVLEHETIFEQRLTNFLQSVFCGVAAVQPFSVALRQIPTSVLYGLFLFLGVISFENNEFYHRMLLFCMTKSQIRRLPKSYFSGVHEISERTIRKFTILQAVLCAIIFVITFTPAEVIFPILIALLILIRLWIYPRMFNPSELDKLDQFVIPSNENPLNESVSTKNLIEKNYDLEGIELHGPLNDDAEDLEEEENKLNYNNHNESMEKKSDEENGVKYIL
jgi:hypothetical protein